MLRIFTVIFQKREVWRCRVSFSGWSCNRAVGWSSHVILLIRVCDERLMRKYCHCYNKTLIHFFILKIKFSDRFKRGLSTSADSVHESVKWDIFLPNSLFSLEQWGSVMTSVTQVYSSQVMNQWISESSRPQLSVPFFSKLVLLSSFRLSQAESG